MAITLEREMNLQQLLSCLPADIQILTSSDLSSALVTHTDLTDNQVSTACNEWKQRRLSVTRTAIHKITAY